MCAGSFVRHRRQSALPMVLSRLHRGQRGFFARPCNCSLVIAAILSPWLPIIARYNARRKIMGQRVEFPSNAHRCQGYFAAPKASKGPAVVVIQEWWGLVPHIEDVVERFAKENFVAVAPDLYHGKIATSPDDAKKLRMEVDAERAEREIAGAGEWLLQQPACSSKTYGVVGFCMGGGLAQYAATKESKVGATVSFYGGFKGVSIDWKNLRAPILLIYGEKDPSFTPEQGRQIEAQL